MENEFTCDWQLFARLLERLAELTKRGELHWMCDDDWYTASNRKLPIYFSFNDKKYIEPYGFTSEHIVVKIISNGIDCYHTISHNLDYSKTAFNLMELIIKSRTEADAVIESMLKELRSL